MKFFKDILGTFTKNGVEIVNLTKTITFKAENSDDYLVDFYISDTQTPESIAEDVYGNSDLWWVVMLSSGNIDRFNDWSMTDEELDSYINWLISEGEITGTQNEIDAIKAENDDKRSIRIINSKYINDFLYDVEKLIAG